jgi:hypothetical protein
VRDEIAKDNSQDTNNPNNEKISIDIIVPSQSLTLLKKFRNNIFIEMENKYKCSITKNIEVFNL